MSDNNTTAAAEVYMKRCLELAQRASGHTAPNPMVGAVLVHEGRVIGEGWHHFYGADHAEVNCLKSVIDEDKGLIPESTMYVNLEPCAHFGITPPCANRLVAERVKRVIIANTDPFAQVSGKGIQILQEAGIEVEHGMMSEEGLWMNRRFFCAHQQQRPYIILKWAQTANGYIAPADKSRFQISNEESRLLVHKWRTEEGAIMVGAKTAMNDNPELTARLWQGKHPLRIVLDRELRLPHTHHVFDKEAATWVINEEKEQLEGNVHFVHLKFDDQLLVRVLQRLQGAKILSLIVEGGAKLLEGFISAGLWDEARIFTGSTSLSDGVPAPLIKEGKRAFETAVGDNRLELYINEKSAYPYVEGMGL